MNNKTNKTFCVKAWNELAISPTGTYTPCCIFEKALMSDEDSVFRVWEDSIESVWHSQDMQEIRSKMLAGQKVRGCDQCYKIEKHGGFSPRNDVNRSIDPDRRFDILPENLPYHMDIKLSNKCNLACRMCQPKDSSRINLEFEKIIEKDREFEIFENSALEDPFLNLELKEIPDWEESDFFKAEMSKMKASLGSMCIAGGEPFFLKSFFDLLDIYIENGKSKDMTITLTTNLTTFPTKKIEILTKNFHRINFNVSLDAVDHHLSYIRYPSKWESVKENILKLCEIIRDTNSMIFFSTTIQTYNILYVHEVFEFVEKLCVAENLISTDESNRRNRCHIVNLTYPKHLNLNTLPDKAREIAVANISAFMKRSERLMSTLDFKSNVEQIISVLRTDFALDIELQQSNFLYYTHVLDKNRFQRFQDFLPELYECYKGLGLKISPPPVTEEYKGRKLLTLRQKGWRLAEGGEYAEAVKCFERSYATGLDPFLDLIEMGWMYNSLGKTDIALEKYKEAVELKPKDFIALRELGATYLYRNQNREAKKYFEKAKKIKPDDEKLLEFLCNKNLKD